MKVCPSCKGQYDENMKFCRKCGVPLITDKASTPNVIAKRHIFETKISQEPGNTDILVEYGDYLLSVGLIDDALIQYFKAIEMKSGDEIVRVRIAEAYHRDKQYDNAITQLLIIMEANPKDIALKEKLYSIYLEANKLNDGAELLRQMHDLEPSNLNHLVRRLDLLRKGGHGEEILEICKKLHQQKSFQYPVCSLYIGIYLSEKANENADPKLWVQAGEMLQDAKTHVGKLNSEEQVSCRVYFCWTQLKLNKNPSDFIQDIKGIGQKLSKTQQTILADCFLMVGNAKFQDELIEDSIESYKTSLSYSDTLQIRQCLAKAYLKNGHEQHQSGKYNEAIKEFRNGLSYQPDNTELQAALAISQTKKKKRQLIRFSAAFAGLIIIISIGLFLYYGQNALEVESNQVASISLTKGKNLIAAKEGDLLQTSLLRYGSYIVQIEKDGYASIKEEINPGIGRRVKKIKYDMKPIYGGLKVSSDPSNAKVVVKNRYTEKSCSTPCEIDQLFAMPSIIEVRIPGYESYKVENTIPQGNVLDLGTVVFKGELKVDSDPSDADVYINDQFKGKTPFQIADLPAQKTKIEIKKKSKGIYIANTGIKPNVLTDLGTVTLSKLGAIRIDSKPQGAKVFLDRAQVGLTPFSISEIEPGSHVVRVEYPACSPIEKNIILQPGEVTDLGTVSFQYPIKGDSVDGKSVGHFLVSSEGVIADSKTGLEWVVGPDRDTDYTQAERWVAACRLSGGRWRIPTRQELSTLYQQGIGERNMDPAFKTTGWWVWAEPNGLPARCYFNFRYGKEISNGSGGSGEVRVFGVRSRPRSVDGKSVDRSSVSSEGITAYSHNKGDNLIAANASGKIVDAPIIRVGDSYTFDTENMSNSKFSYIATREVTAIEGNRLTVVTTNAKSGSKRTNYYDRTWGYLGSGTGDNDGMSFSPALKYLDFPLSVGKKWTAQSIETDNKTKRQRQHTINGTVVGWEKIQIPAGEFEALKIVLNTEVKEADLVSHGTDISWYVPALRRSVKSELTGQDASTGQEEKKIIRLISYHVQ